MKRIMILSLLAILVFAPWELNAQVFTNYIMSNSGLPEDYISGGVAVDNNNHIWFGTSAGVAEFDGVSTWNVYDTSDGVVDMFINCVAVDKNNNVWVGTNNGVSKYNGTSWTTYTTADGLADNSVVYIAGDINGDVWFATYAGASKLNGTTFTNYTTSDGLPVDAITFIMVDTLGNKWFGTVMGGISKYNNSAFITIDTDDNLVDNSVFAIAIDQDYHKWVGTWYGMSELNNADAWVADYDSAGGMYNDYIRDIDVDTRGYVWLGHFADYNQEGGVSVFTGSMWARYSVPEGLVDKQVIRLAIDDYDNVWVATGLGVSKISGFTGIQAHERLTPMSAFPNPANEHITIKANGSPESLLITDITGKKAYEFMIKSDARINTALWPAGLYIARTGSRVIKFAVQH
jgi:ligand-binding sensor domain-containing protein